MDSVFQWLLAELAQWTRACEQERQEIATRLIQEVDRICVQSQRIQRSGAVEQWFTQLAKHRCQQCIHYYQLGSQRARVELHTTLGALIYCHITGPDQKSTLRSRLMQIDEFLQGFYVETLNAFRRENELPADYRPQTLLQLAEYIGFTERYAKRRIPLPGRQAQYLIILRAQSFSQRPTFSPQSEREQSIQASQPFETTEQSSPSTQVERPENPQALSIKSLQHRLHEALILYLQEQDAQEFFDYIILRLQNRSDPEIAERLELSPRQLDNCQKRFQYHILRFALWYWKLQEDDINQSEQLQPIWRSQQSLDPDSTAEDALRQRIIDRLALYLKQHQLQDCIDYLALRLQNLTHEEITEILGRSPRSLDFLQQKFKYHLIRLALKHRQPLVDAGGDD